MDVTELIAAGGHEQVVFFADGEVGLRGIIAIHSTALGPSLGGIRFWRYASEHDALIDVLRLSAAMSCKASISGLDQGGGKGVVFWDDARRPRDEALLRALGRQIDRLGGRYIAAEDVGATQADMDGIALETPWVTGIDPARGGSGDPSPVTALGVLHGMHAACEAAFGDRSLEGRRVVVSGVGHVGAHLVALLVDAGARVAVSDIDDVKVRAAVDRHGVEALAVGEEVDAECDVLAPCALGGVLTAEAIARLRCAVVCGAANNQLLDDAADDALAEQGIVYAPDFVVNAGGIINIAGEWAPGGYVREDALARAVEIEDTTRSVLAFAREQRLAPGRAAEVLARRRIETEGRARGFQPGDPSPLFEALAIRFVGFRFKPDVAGA